MNRKLIKITHPNHTEQTLRQEQEINLENLQRIMYKKKTRLLLLRNRLESS